MTNNWKYNKRGPIVVLLFGSPGSGKSTQGKLLAQHLALERISPGDMLRAHMAAGDPLGQEITGAMEAGRFVPDEIVNQLIRDRIVEPGCAKGFILDGYPRTVNQAVTVLDLLKSRGIEPIAVRLMIDADAIVIRLSGRLQCPNCGALYQEKFQPPKVACVCDYDGDSLIVLDGDGKSLIRSRLSDYNVRTMPAFEVLKAQGHVCTEANADREIAVIAAEIENFIRNAITG